MIKDDVSEKKEKLEKEIIEARKRLKHLEQEYYEKYLKGEGD